MNYRKTLTALAVVAGLILAGCSDTSDTIPDMSTEEHQASPHNGADVEFSQQMIPHHQQALEMAALAPSRAKSQEVKDLAADIEAAQDPEIQTMSDWLKGWDEDVPNGMGGHKMGDGSTMGDDPMGEGMMSEDEMSELKDAKGAEFDRLFLTMMIKHHEGAIAMAKDEQSAGENPHAVALAKRIESAQAAEIKLMKRLLAE